jgi:branched-chain amino acid transport system ATP-binding protein
MDLLKVTGLTKRFGGLAAVDSVDLAIPQGEIVGLIGPNGAGKTTFVELLTGATLPTSGRIEFQGRDITRLPSYQRCRLGIARTFQVPAPFMGVTVLENVMTACMFGRSEKDIGREKARELSEKTLREVKLHDARDKAPGELTTAGLKRLELARCLATGASMLFLDEPLGGLNQTEVNEALTLIRNVHARGVTIVFIEHIVPAVLSLCSRVVVLADGKKLMEGSAQEVVAHPEVRRAYLGDVAASAKQRQRAADMRDAA